MDRGIRLETTSSYDENKYESLGVVNAAMSVTVSFTPQTPPKTSFFGSAPKVVPVDKQQKLTSTENQMLKALKKQLIINAPPGTERLIDFKISPPENIAHPPEYILSMLASATAIKKSQGQVQPQLNVPVNAPMANPPVANMPVANPPVANMPVANAQMPVGSPGMSQLPQMSKPLDPMSRLPQMSKPLDQNLFKRQLGGKKYKSKVKLTKKKKRHAKKTRKHHH